MQNKNPFSIKYLNTLSLKKHSYGINIIKTTSKPYLNVYVS